MKLVREHIDEKFIEDSDPVHDMGIGLKPLIEKWLKTYNIDSYVINYDLTIDVNRDVYLNNRQLNNFPEYIQFNNINGSFWIDNNNFTTLRGCPRSTDSFFSCRNNQLTSLKYAPKDINTILYCNRNPISDKEFVKYALNPDVNDSIVIYCDNLLKFHGKYVKTIREEYKER
jgi:hypothetical protein